MDTESITARRRLASVAAHFPATTYDPASTASLAPLNCSTSLNSHVVTRCDNKLSFARQASSEQGFFMRQASSTDKEHENYGISSLKKDSVIRRCDNKLFFARQASSAQGFFMRQASTHDQRTTISQDATTTTKTTDVLSLLSKPEYAAPQFSKPAKDEFVFSSVPPNQLKEKPTKPDLPKLANLGTVWSPRSNVAEFEHNYVVAVELPGASINDIRVEVNNTNLTVTGRRTSICQRVDAGTKDPIQGPFKVSWPLPSNVNKDNVSAEFMDGLLRIVLPKL